MNISIAIKILLSAHGWAVIDLYKELQKSKKTKIKIKLSYSYLRNLTAGRYKKQPSLKVIKSIADALHTPLAFFIFLAQEEEKEDHSYPMQSTSAKIKRLETIVNEHVGSIAVAYNIIASAKVNL